MWGGHSWPPILQLILFLVLFLLMPLILALALKRTAAGFAHGKF
jgi:hypothetical protein